MRTRTFLRRGVLPLSCLALLTIWAQTGRPQPAPDRVAPPARADEAPPAPPSVSTATVPPPAYTPYVTLPTVPPTPEPAPATEPTVEALIKHLEQLRKQRADLEAQEKAVVTKLRERLKDQGDRLTKLGVLPPAPLPPVEAPVPERPPVIIPESPKK